MASSSNMDDSITNYNDDDDFLTIPKFETPKSSDDDQTEHCPTCSKDLRHLDALHRSQHINKCLDKDEVKGKVEQIRDTYEKTRDCPLCFEPLTPGPHRITHYKRCSKAHNVSAAEMNEMISHNDRVAQIRKRAGIKHTRARQETDSSLETNISTKMRKKNKVGPKSLEDEQLQMALALSMSENYIDLDTECTVTSSMDAPKLKDSGGLKQITLPTVLESTTVENRSILLQERLYQIVLSQNVVNSSSLAKGKQDKDLWQSRWWRMHSSNDLQSDEYKIDILRAGTFDVDLVDKEYPDGGPAKKIVDECSSADSPIEIARGDPERKVDDVDQDSVVVISSDEEEEDKAPIVQVDDAQQQAATKIDIDNSDQVLSGDRFDQQMGDDDDEFFNNLPLDISKELKEKSVRKLDDEFVFSTPIACSSSSNANTNDVKCTPASLSRSKQKNLWDRRGIYVLKRRNVSPTPDYKSMSTPLIKDNLKKHGFRICARRKAIKLLTRTYNSTHPYMTDQGDVIDVEPLEDTPKAGTSKQAANKCKAPTIKTRNLASKLAQCKDGKKPTKKSVKKAVESPSQSSADSSFEEHNEAGRVLEESILTADQDGDSIDSESQGASSKDLPNQLSECFRSSEELYKRILQYEPLPFKYLQDFVRQAGIRCSAAKLLDYLDTQGITFTMKGEEDATKPFKWQPRVGKKNK